MAPSLLLLFVSSLWAALAWSLPLMLATATAAAAAAQRRGDCPPVRCGNVTISSPFGLVLEPAMMSNCGVPGFEVRCTKETPYLGHDAGIYGFQILDIFYDNASLIIADVHKLQDFNSSSGRGCHAPTSNSIKRLGYPYSISTVNQNLIFYICTKVPAVAFGEGLVEARCRNDTFVRVAERYDESGGYGSYFLEGCDATVVPVVGKHGEANASRYDELISDGFLLTWQLPPSTEPATCGNLTIKYPFWLGGGNQSSSPCGHPAFQVWCSNVTGVASLKGSAIHVRRIDYANNSFVAYQ
ncbi:hypothetical protein ACP70R_030419 [Stipagrostis hirtigluma subsp. patula]